jgi:hypothetical protein
MSKLQNKKEPSVLSKKVEDLTATVLTMKTELLKEKKIEKKLKTALIFVLIFTAGAGVGFGVHYFDVVGKLKDVTAELRGTKTSLELSEQKLAQEAKNAQDKENQLTEATKVNEVLKQEAAKKAEIEAKQALKAQKEAEKNAKKYVIADKKESNLPGLNTRKSPCGELETTYRVWGTGGEVLAGPDKPGPCLDGDHEWYQVKWNDGITGWSIVDYLTFSSQQQINNTGYITGYAPVSYDYKSETKFNPTICATNTGDGISYCNAVVDSDNYNYKLLVPAGNYTISGSIRYRNYENDKVEDKRIIYSKLTQCNYEKACLEDGISWNTPVVVNIKAGEVVTSINPLVPYNPLDYYGGNY